MTIMDMSMNIRLIILSEMNYLCLTCPEIYHAAPDSDRIFLPPFLFKASKFLLQSIPNFPVTIVSSAHLL